jgi:hypothetical protein
LANFKALSDDKESTSAKSAYSGTMCSHAKKRLTKALNLLVAIARPKTAFNPKTGKRFNFRVNFITLTLPCAQRSVSDRDLKTKVFDPFIKSMKRKHGLRSYVWRAERQFNGNLHFHLTTDSFLPLSSIRDEWNRFLSRFHFINEFHSNHGHFTPNSTDVHSVHQIANIAAYMVKYMSKSDDDHLAEINAKRVKLGKPPIDPSKHPFRRIDGQPEWNQPIEGKVWDCSSNLKSKDSCVMESDSKSRDDLRHVVRHPNTTHVSTDHCFIVPVVKGRMEEVLPPRLKTMYQDYLNRIRCYHRAPKSILPDKIVLPMPVKVVKVSQLAIPLMTIYNTKY